MIAQDPTSAKCIFEFDNWTKQARLGCGQDKTRELAKTYYFVASVIAILVLIMTSDYIGRKYSFYAACIVTTAGMIIAISIPNYYIRLIGLGIATASFTTYSSLYTIYFSEYLRTINFIQRKVMTLEIE